MPHSLLRSTKATPTPLSAELFALVESLDAVSERELRVRFTARDANWLFNVASLPIVSRKQYGEFWQRLPASGQTLSGFDWSGTLPIGTGPWRITEWDAAEVSSPGSTGTGEEGRGSTSSRSRPLTDRTPDWKHGKTETRRCSGRYAFARCSN